MSRKKHDIGIDENEASKERDAILKRAASASFDFDYYDERIRKYRESYSDKAEFHRKKLGLSIPQFVVFKDPARFRIFVAGRRTGKTYLAVHEIVRAAQTGRKKSVAYIGPYLKQSKRIMWKQLKQAIPKNMISAKNETSLELTLKGYESTISIFGADNADSIRGNGFDFIVLDEVADIPLAVWYEVLRPTLSTTNGHALFIGTPKPGTWIQDLFYKAENPDNTDWAAWSFTSYEGGNVPRSEVEAAREDLTATQFAQEYLASFVNPAGAVYTEFNRSIHVNHEIAVDDGISPIIMGSDQNVSPYSVVFGQQRIVDGKDTLIIFGELCEYGTHTMGIIEQIKQRYLKRDSGFWEREMVMCPDPSSRQRKTSGAGMTDFSQFGEAGIRTCAPSRTPKVRDRINTMQARFMNANGDIGIYIHPRCKNLIKSLESLVYTPGSDVPQKGSYDHMCDALGYLIWWFYPMRKRRLGMIKLNGV